MLRRIVMISILIISMFSVYNLTRPEGGAVLNVQEEINPKAIPEIESLPLEEKLLKIESEIFAAKNQLAKTKAIEERLQLEDFINTAQSWLDKKDFSKEKCDQYKNQTANNEQAYKLLEEVCI